jgi:hypothetical protein
MSPNSQSYTDPTQLTVHGAASPKRWRISATSDQTQLTLPRVLQKLAVPAATLSEAHYVAGASGMPARIEIVIQTTPAWANLLCAKLRMLTGMREVKCHPEADPT